MEFTTTFNFLNSDCVRRINVGMKKRNLKQSQIYPDDKSLISNVVKGKLGKNNPYLIPLRLVYDKKNKVKYENGLIDKLGYESAAQLYWGTKDELERNLEFYYTFIMYDLYDNKSQLNNPDINLDIDTLLCDYVPYARFFTFKQIKDEKNICLLNNYGIYDELVSPLNMCRHRNDAIHHFYSKKNFRTSFRETFLDFAYSTKDNVPLSTIVKTFDKKYVIPIFIPLLKENFSVEKSYGIRVKNLIECDIVKSHDLIDAYQKGETIPDSNILKMLINATSGYIVKLEKIQEEIRKSNSNL